MKTFGLAVLALTLASCVAVVKAPPSNDPPPQPAHNPNPPPPRNNPPPPPPQPVGPEASLELKYDASIEQCFAASRKALGFMKFTESEEGKKVGEITAYSGKVWVHCTMRRYRHHTLLTFHFRINDPRADARIPGDLAARCHKFVGEEMKEEGRKTD